MIKELNEIKYEIYLRSRKPLISIAPQNETSPSPWEKCISPVLRLAPSTNTGRYIFDPLLRFFMSQFPPFSLPGIVLAASLAIFSHSWVPFWIYICRKHLRKLNLSSWKVSLILNMVVRYCYKVTLENNYMNWKFDYGFLVASGGVKWAVPFQGSILVVLVSWPMVVDAKLHIVSKTQLHSQEAVSPSHSKYLRVLLMELFRLFPDESNPEILLLFMHISPT